MPSLVSIPEPQRTGSEASDKAWSATSSLVDYVCRLDERSIDMLFTACDLTVFGILRALPPLAKIILFRFLALSDYVQEIPAHIVTAWIADPRTEERNDPVWGHTSRTSAKSTSAFPDSERERNLIVSRILHVLTRLRFLRRTVQEQPSNGTSQELVTYALTPAIREHLLRYLWATTNSQENLEGACTPRRSSASSVDASTRASWIRILEPFQRIANASDGQIPTRLTAPQLREYTRHAWEHVLHFVIGIPVAEPEIRQPTGPEHTPEHVMEPPSDEVIEALLSLGVSEQVGSDGMRITERGFSYLLLDIHAQLWALLEAYVENWDEARGDRLELFDLLFRLGFSVPGHIYDGGDPSLSAAQCRMLGFLAEIGLVYLMETEQSRQDGDNDEQLVIRRRRPGRPLYLHATSTKDSRRSPDGQARFTSSPLQPLGSLMDANDRVATNISAAVPGKNDLTFDRRVAALLKKHSSRVLFSPTPLGTQLMMGPALDPVVAREQPDAVPRHAEILIESEPVLATPSAGRRPSLGRSILSGSPFQIIVETNFRLYAYAASSFQVALLSLFTRILYRMPGVAIGVITRDSVRRALKCGITAKQLLHFLGIHSMEGKSVPFNVHDQILLWELERKRIQAYPGVLLEGFEPTSDGRAFFDQLQEYTVELGAQQWCDRVRQLLVADASSFERLREWIRRQAQTLS